MARKTISWLDAVINDLNIQISDKNSIIDWLNNNIKSNQNEILELENIKSDNLKKIDELSSLITIRDSKISELDNVVSERDENINDLNSNISERDWKIEALNESVWEKDIEIEELNNDILWKNTEISDLEVKISEKDSENKELKLSLNQFEVRKFAVAFEDEKNEYNKKIDIWRPVSIYAFIILLFTTFIITIISFFIGNLDKLSLLIIESVAVLFAIFSTKQYLYYTNHYSDALRRQTLAQWYQHILEWTEDEKIKPEYKEKLVNVLCNNEKKGNKYKFPQEQLIEKVVDLTDSVTKLLWKQ